MISRVAESCFWLSRYIERIESLARLLYVNQTSALEGPSAEDRWKSLVIVTGEEERFEERPAPSEEKFSEAVEEFLTWDKDNPSSIYSNLYWARENARTVREIISREMWETLNEAWVWIQGREARKLYQGNRYRFYLQMRHICTQFHGYGLSTMLHDQAFDFLRLGGMLERAGQTARTLDVKYHILGRTRINSESPEEAAQWLAILYSCSGVEPFFKHSDSVLSGPAVAEFLIYNRKFPRSIRHCLDRSRNFLKLVGAGAPSRNESTAEKKLSEMLDDLNSRDMSGILKQGLHNVLTGIIDQTAEICTAVNHDYFDPMVSVSRKAG